MQDDEPQFDKETRAGKEIKLIAKIVDVGDFRSVLDAAITADKFKSLDCRLMYEYIYDYWRNKRTLGNVPTRDLLEEKFPTVNLPHPDRLTISSALEEFQSWDIRARLGELSTYISDYGERPDKLLIHIEREAREMLQTRRITQDIVVSEAAEVAKKMYEDNKNPGVLRGLPYPWKVLND